MKRTKGKLRGWRGVSKSGQRKINGYALGWKTPRAEIEDVIQVNQGDNRIKRMAASFPILTTFDTAQEAQGSAYARMLELSSNTSAIERMLGSTIYRRSKTKEMEAS